MKVSMPKAFVMISFFMIDIVFMYFPEAFNPITTTASIVLAMVSGCLSGMSIVYCCFPLWLDKVGAMDMARKLSVFKKQVDD